MVACVAYGCTNRTSKKIPGISFHRFPSDQYHKLLWIKAIYRRNWKPTAYSRLCSAHFAEESIDRTMHRVVLKPGAVPTIFPAFPPYLQNITKPREFQEKQNATSPKCEPSTSKHYSTEQMYNTKQECLEQETEYMKTKNVLLKQKQCDKQKITNLKSALDQIKNKELLELDVRTSNMSCSKRKRRISNDTSEESENEVVSEENNTNDTAPYFSTIENDIKNPLTLKKLRAVPCGNYAAETCFKWFIHPILPNEFFKETFEKKPLFVKRDNSCYYKDLFTGKDFHNIMRKNLLEFTKNIDVVSYTDGERVTLNPEGRAYAPVVWDFYQQGCSIRMRNPQAYSKKLWQLCSLLQEYFGSFVGVNMYLTPPGSQGFAPHFDDIEAFILQLEGSKHWRVYSPRSQKETLPSYSSGNFSQDEIGTPVCELEMKPGDLLYFPRGFIHQAKTPEDTHSLHITVSTYQKNTWGHLLQLALPSALSKAIENELELRESLPKDYLNYVGEVEVNRYNDCPERHRFIEKVTSLAQSVIKYLPIDEAADHHAKDFIHGSMPPFLTKREKECSIHGGGEYWEDGQVKSIVELQPDSKIRFIRKRFIRMVIEENSARIYHTIENGKDYKEFDLKFVECDLDAIPAFQFLLQGHPKFILIEELPLKTLEDKMNFANDLYANGFLMTEEPLESMEE